MDLKRELSEIYTFKTELHLHSTPVSRCARVGAEGLVEKYSALGFSALTLTNHIDPASRDYSEDEWVSRYMEGFYELSGEAEKKGMRAYLGLEVRFCENANDYLVYGVDADTVALAYRHLDKGIEAFYKAAKTDKNLIVQAHPFRDNMELNFTEQLDGIELFNMAGHNARIALGARFCEQHKGVVLGGNDLHYEENYPVFSTLFKEPLRDSFELAAAIKSEDYIFKLGNSLILP